MHLCSTANLVLFFFFSIILVNSHAIVRYSLISHFLGIVFGQLLVFTLD